MPIHAPGDRVVRFGPCVVNLTARWVTRGDVLQALNPKEWQVLAILLSRQGELVSFQEFEDAVWPDVSIELKPGMHARISSINRALGTSDYIENVRDKGYRFRASVPIEETTVPFPQTAGGIIEGPPNGLSAPAATPRPPRARWQVTVAALGLLLAAAAGVMAVRNSRSVREPSRVVLKGRVLVMLDQEDTPMWQFTLPGQPNPPNPPPNAYHDARPVITDIDGDGEKEALYPFRNLDNSEYPETLYCFDSHGSVLWTRQIGREIQTLGGRPYPRHYSLTWVGILGHSTPEGGRVVVGGRRGGTSIFAVEVLTSRGKVVGEYYHPGWLWAMGTMDLDQDGWDEIILGGVNNAHGNVPGFEHPLTLVVLDSRKVEGQGPVPAEDERHFRGLSSGSEKAVLFLRTFGELPTDPPERFCIIREIRVRERHFEVIADRLGSYGVSVDYQFDSRLSLQIALPSIPLARILDSKRSLTSTSHLSRYQYHFKELGDVRVLKNDLAGPHRAGPALFAPE